MSQEIIGVAFTSAAIAHMQQICDETAPEDRPGLSIHPSFGCLGKAGGSPARGLVVGTLRPDEWTDHTGAVNRWPGTIPIELGGRAFRISEDFDHTMAGALIDAVTFVRHGVARTDLVDLRSLMGIDGGGDAGTGGPDRLTT